jgi:hypothetical protein
MFRIMIESDKHPRNLPVTIEGQGARESRRTSPRLDRANTVFDAQLIGQPGKKRGLRGGEEVLKQARSSYLETEYSGPSDRRPSKGLLKKTEI